MTFLTKEPAASVLRTLFVPPIPIAQFLEISLNVSELEPTVVLQAAALLDPIANSHRAPKIAEKMSEDANKF